MCGFAGELRPHRAVDPDVLERMSARLAPRGPDAHGTWTHGGVGLTHRRLKVIDLTDAGAQPMTDDAAGLTVVFNGCVYNHHELRAELAALGHRFRSVSDTEVVLRSWVQWGEDAVDRFLGMFAFAVADHRSGRVTLARDRLGVKPLYLAPLSNGGLRFGSTLPALLAGGGLDTTVDPVALHSYLSLHAIVPAPRTILRGVRKLAPASLLVVEPDGRTSERRYWDPPFTRSVEHGGWSAEDWRDAVREATRVAVRRRMVADVPVGILLSGGLDSSLIVGLLAAEGQTGLATFSIGFDRVGDRDGDEFAYSDLVAREFGTDHRRIHVGVDDLLAALPHAIDAMSEPMVSHDAVAFWLLSREVSQTRKVVQSGQGADEVFAGYSWYPPLRDATGDGVDAYAAEFFDRDDEQIRALVRDALRVDGDPTRAAVRRDFLRPGADTPLDRALRSDSEIMLVDDPVKRVDNMTMAHGLEARTPFLDHELVELAARCPADLKLAHGGKGIVKDAARGLIPDAVIDREKGYFPVPALSHLEEPVISFVREALYAPAARERGLFDPATVDAMLADPNGYRTNLDGSALWQLGLLELWLQQHT